MVKGMWTPDLNAHMWFFSKVLNAFPGTKTFKPVVAMPLSTKKAPWRQQDCCKKNPPVSCTDP